MVNVDVKRGERIERVLMGDVWPNDALVTDVLLMQCAPQERQRGRRGAPSCCDAPPPLARACAHSNDRQSSLGTTTQHH